MFPQAPSAPPMMPSRPSGPPPGMGGGMPPGMPPGMGGDMGGDMGGGAPVDEAQVREVVSKLEMLLQQLYQKFPFLNQ